VLRRFPLLRGFILAQVLVNVQGALFEKLEKPLSLQSLRREELLVVRGCQRFFQLFEFLLNLFHFAHYLCVFEQRVFLKGALFLLIEEVLVLFRLMHQLRFESFQFALNCRLRKLDKLENVEGMVNRVKDFLSYGLALLELIYPLNHRSGARLKLFCRLQKITDVSFRGLRN